MKEKEIICRGPVQCWEETWPQQGKCEWIARDSVGGDGAGRKERQDHTWACHDTSLYPENSGKPLRKSFNQRVTGPGRLAMAFDWGKTLTECRKALESIVLVQIRDL